MLYQLSYEVNSDGVVATELYSNMYSSVIVAQLVGALDLSLLSTYRKSQYCVKYCDWMKVLVANLQVGFCDEWKRGFKPRGICSREQRKKKLDWLVTNTDDITSQSHSLFACSREKNRQVGNGLYRFATRCHFRDSHQSVPCSIFLYILLFGIFWKRCKIPREP